jgi:hypothetical protein
MNVYSIRRREPRVKLTTKALIIDDSVEGSSREIECVTIDLSPHGASVFTEEELPIGTVIHFRGIGYSFDARARIRSVAKDRASGKNILGLEYLDNSTNPLVIWLHILEDTRGEVSVDTEADDLQ